MLSGPVTGPGLWAERMGLGPLSLFGLSLWREGSIGET